MLSDQTDVVTGKRTKPTLSKKEILERKVNRALPKEVVEKRLSRKFSGEELRKEVNKARLTTEDATTVPSLKTWLKKNKNRALSGATEGDLTEYFVSQGN